MAVFKAFDAPKKKKIVLKFLKDLFKTDINFDLKTSLCVK